MDVAIIGGGAAGIAAAISIKALNVSVSVYENNREPLKKLSITGNGHANISNKFITASDFNNITFANKVLNKINNETLISFFKEIGLAVRFDSEGRMYPFDENAKELKDILVSYAHHMQVKFYNKMITDIHFDNGFLIDDKKYDYLILACGGRSQNYGIEDKSFLLPRSFGHKITRLKPSLCPLYCQSEIIKGLDGLRVKGQVSFDGFSEAGEIQIKRDALSGIVIFNLSSYLNQKNIQKAQIKINLIPDVDIDFIFEQKWKYLDVAFNGLVNNKLMNNILKHLRINKRFVGDLSEEEIDRITECLRGLELLVDGFYDFNSAQVTSGGVCLDEVDEYMQSRLVKNLFIVGEMLDIDGRCGGFNLHMAFATGIIAGRYINDDINRKR